MAAGKSNRLDPSFTNDPLPPQVSVDRFQETNVANVPPTRADAVNLPIHSGALEHRSILTFRFCFFNSQRALHSAPFALGAQATGLQKIRTPNPLKRARRGQLKCMQERHRPHRCLLEHVLWTRATASPDWRDLAAEVQQCSYTPGKRCHTAVYISTCRLRHSIDHSWAARLGEGNTAVERVGCIEQMAWPGA